VTKDHRGNSDNATAPDPYAPRPPSSPPPLPADLQAGSAAAAALAALEAAAADGGARFSREAAAAALGVLCNAAGTRAGAQAVLDLGGMPAAVRAAARLRSDDDDGRQRACLLLVRLAQLRPDALREVRPAGAGHGALQGRAAVLAALRREGGQAGAAPGGDRRAALGVDYCALVVHLLGA
jgi:hypothetical protein